MPFEFLECLKFGGDIVMVFPLIPKTKERERKKCEKDPCLGFLGGLVS
jgi:hypothetical protein